jgi:hypothetical protein
MKLNRPREVRKLASASGLQQYQKILVNCVCQGRHDLEGRINPALLNLVEELFGHAGTILNVAERQPRCYPRPAQIAAKYLPSLRDLAGDVGGGMPVQKDLLPFHSQQQSPFVNRRQLANLDTS